MSKELGKFRIGSKVSELWFWVYVYDDIKKLRLDNKEYKEQDDFDDCLAVCQPTERIIFEKNKKGKMRERRYENIGIIRILKTAGTEVSSHEVLHATFWNYRLEHKRKTDFGGDVSENEESFCRLFGHLYRNLVVKMYKYGYWK